MPDRRSGPPPRTRRGDPGPPADQLPVPLAVVPTVAPAPDVALRQAVGHPLSPPAGRHRRAAAPCLRRAAHAALAHRFIPGDGDPARGHWSRGLAGPATRTRAAPP